MFLIGVLDVLVVSVNLSLFSVLWLIFLLPVADFIINFNTGALIDGVHVFAGLFHVNGELHFSFDELVVLNLVYRYGAGSTEECSYYLEFHLNL